MLAQEAGETLAPDWKSSAQVPEKADPSGLAVPSELEMPALEALPFSDDFHFYEPTLPVFQYYPGMSSFTRNYTDSGYLGLRAGIGIIGGSVYDEHPFLITSNGVNLGISRNFGALGLKAYASATHYSGMYMPGINQFGISAMAEYAINDNVSMVAFGSVYNRVPMASMAIYPYVNTNVYGGYVSFNGDRLGLDVGAERYFDPASRRWETMPIVTPKFKISDNASISIPVGGMIKAAVDDAHMRMSPPPPPPGPHRDAGRR